MVTQQTEQRVLYLKVWDPIKNTLCEEVVPSKYVDPPRSGRTVTGYGRRIPTNTMVYYRGRWYRVYARCFSNASTCYIVAGQVEVIVDDRWEVVPGSVKQLAP